MNKLKMAQQSKSNILINVNEKIEEVANLIGKIFWNSSKIKGCHYFIVWLRYSI